MSQTAGASPRLVSHGGRLTPIIFYSSIGYDQAAAAAFTKKFHIPIEVEHNATGAVLAQIEASRNTLRWGMWWTDGPTNFTLLDSQHMLPRGFQPLVDWTALGREVLPKDGSYVPTGLTVAAAVVYDKTKVTHPPTTWLDLLEPQWKNKVGMDEPAISGPTYPFVAGAMVDLGAPTVRPQMAQEAERATLLEWRWFLEEELLGLLAERYPSDPFAMVRSLIPSPPDRR